MNAEATASGPIAHIMFNPTGPAAEWWGHTASYCMNCKPVLCDVPQHWPALHALEGSR